MSVIMLAPLLGGAVGPAISGAVAQTLGWRQVLFLAAGLAVACEVLFFACFRETYKVPILRRRAAKWRDENPDDADVGKEFESHSAARVWESVLRPALVLYGSGVLFILSIFGSVLFAYFYVLCVSLPDVLEEIYGLSPAATGSVFMCFSKPFPSLSRICNFADIGPGIGSLVSVLICNLTLDKLYIKLRDANKGVGLPEFRLPFVIFGGFTLPFSVALYGWTAELRLPLPLLLFSIGLIGFTLLLGFLPLMAYVVDGWGLYAASATTGVIVMRCLAGTFLPLATGPLVDRFGYGWGFSVFGLVSLVMAPIPVLIMRYGPVWRQRSRYTRET
jgi:MFS family permease